ncbi:hypothetical protein DL765_005533 [Monosporascus sp. GIB2]|nr:hypothetical protein DL765_005533 [Monosporascus sp. GIB2]
MQELGIGNGPLCFQITTPSAHHHDYHDLPLQLSLVPGRLGPGFAHGRRYFQPSLIHRSGIKRYVDTFRGGAVIDIPQLSHDKSAILSVEATWNVGITGGHCNDSAGSALLQAGYGYGFHPGDNIRVTIRIDTTEEGFTEIQNLNTGQNWSDAVVNPHPGAAGSAMCLGNGTAWFLNEWMLGVPGAKPDRDRTVLPVFSNISFADVQAHDWLSHRFNLGGPTADYWNTTQAGTETPVFVSEPVGAEEFVFILPRARSGFRWRRSRGWKLYLYTLWESRNKAFRAVTLLAALMICEASRFLQ